MAQLYKRPISAKHFRKEVRADLVVLDANSNEMASKVFFANNGLGLTTLSSTPT